jgi:hypothetical protein
LYGKKPFPHPKQMVVALRREVLIYDKNTDVK